MTYVQYVRFYSALKIENQKQHFCKIMFFYFKKGKNAYETARKICKVYCVQVKVLFLMKQFEGSL